MLRAKSDVSGILGRSQKLNSERAPPPLSTPFFVQLFETYPVLCFLHCCIFLCNYSKLLIYSVVDFQVVSFENEKKFFSLLAPVR